MIKNIGYRAPQFYNENLKDVKDLPKKFKAIWKKMGEKAKKQYVNDTDYYLKNTVLYFMYEENAYCVGLGTLKIEDFQFEGIVNELMDVLYENGCYEMFYAGEID